MNYEWLRLNLESLEIQTSSRERQENLTIFKHQMAIYLLVI
jgi:hypothetical protein